MVSRDSRLELLTWAQLILQILLLAFLAFINYKVNENRVDIDTQAIDIEDLRVDKQARERAATGEEQ